MAEGGFKKPEHAGQAGEEKHGTEMHTHQHMHNHTHTHQHAAGSETESHGKDMVGESGEHKKTDTASEKKEGEKVKSMSSRMYDHKKKAKPAENDANKGE